VSTYWIFDPRPIRLLSNEPGENKKIRISIVWGEDREWVDQT